MIKNIKGRKIIFIISSIILSFFILLFISSQTILFTWSPIRLGYNCFHFNLYDVYAKSNELETAYKNLDDIIIQNENEHTLKYTIKPEIVICKKSDIGIYSPWIGPNNSIGVWPKTVYLSTFAINKFKDPGSSIKHELSHILLLQNFGNSICMKIWQSNEWLPEGYAVYVTDGFPSYMSKSQLLSKMKEYKIDYKINSSDILSGKSVHKVSITTKFQIYYYFIKFLIEKHSKEPFISFLHDTFSNSDDIMDQFYKHFNITFGNALIEFNKYLNEI